MLGNIKPREQSGRDALARFRIQARSAALASLAILEGGDIDRVYCDMHDDFVVRINRNGLHYYSFYQVKTHSKKNHNWTLNEVFGLNSRIKDLSKHQNSSISNSFAGRLLMHTVVFGENCEAVIFQTNINIDDLIEELVEDIRNGQFENKLSNLLIERFSDCFLCPDDNIEKIKSHLKKLKFDTDVQHIKLENNNFAAIAKEAIYQYSEIDLTHDEFKDILIKLVELVEKKSSGIIKELNSESIETLSGISVFDLLEILSISKAAYKALIEGGDLSAVKNASIIQRTLNSTGASEDQIEYLSRCKIQWDEWFRNNRHVLPELKVMTIQNDLAEILTSTLTNNKLSISLLRKPVENYMSSVKDYGLNENIILGGIMAELVRRKI